MRKIVMVILYLVLSTSLNGEENRGCPIACIAGTGKRSDFCNLDVKGLLTTKNLCVQGDTQIQGDLTLCGTINGSFTAVTGPAGATGATGSLDTTSPLFLSNTGDAMGCTGGNPALRVAGGVLIGGNLGVSGNIEACGFINTSVDYRLGGTTILIEDLEDEGNLSVGFGTNNVANGEDNTAVGFQALASNISGDANTAVGFFALESNTIGSDNVAVGAESLANNIDGNTNVAIGFRSMVNNTSGLNNVAVGAASLLSNISGLGNVAVGFSALFANTTGINNIAVGPLTLANNTIGASNIGMGFSALLFNTQGINNIGIGSLALAKNISGADNISIGTNALASNIIGNRNIAIGPSVLANHPNGSDNIAVGREALVVITNGDNNVALGSQALNSLIQGDNNIAIGDDAGSAMLNPSDNNIIIGNIGMDGDNGVIRIGGGVHTNCFIQGIFGVTPAGAPEQVIIDANGELGSMAILPSSNIYKKDIQPLGSTTEKLMQLQPVEFSYIHDQNNARHFGLIAEEVEKIYPEIIQYTKDGTIYTINYIELIPLLLHQIQIIEQQRQNEHKELIQMRAIMQTLLACPAIG